MDRVSAAGRAGSDLLESNRRAVEAFDAQTAGIYGIPEEISPYHGSGSQASYGYYRRP